MAPGFTTHKSRHGRKQKRTLNTPVSPWEISDTYPELQMSAILMNTLKIKFLGIRSLRISLKSQHSLAGVVLQNTQEIYLLIPEQGGTCTILNEICCFWVNTSSQVKESLTVLKHADPMGSQRTRWRVLGITTVSLWGILLLARVLMIVPCTISSLTHFISVYSFLLYCWKRALAMASLFSWGKTLLAFALLHFVLHGQTCPLLQVSHDFLLLHSSAL